jgi:uncharacterized Tic20 family protein
MVATTVQRAAEELQPSQQDRVLAGAAYLISLAGFWFFGPLALYFWKGKTSRFLGFHSIQAILLHLAAIPFTLVGVALAIVVQVAIGIIGNRGGSHEIAEGVGILLMLVALGVALVLPLFMTVWMGISVMRGKPGRVPIVSRLTERIVA